MIVLNLFPLHDLIIALFTLESYEVPGPKNKYITSFGADHGHFSEYSLPNFEHCNCLVCPNLSEYCK